MLKTLTVAARDRARLAEIAQVASRFGLDLALARLGLSPGASSDTAGDAPDLPRRVRLALEALGPTFVKLGQIAATRADLLPTAWIAELEQLHSRAATLPFETIRPEIERALGEEADAAFARVDPVPLAAASMAQVHRATLVDGKQVVLKVQRPGIRPRMEADLRLIAQLAAVAEATSAEARRFRPSAMIQQLAAAVLEELDFTVEGRNADRLREDFAGDRDVVVPVIHWPLSSGTLLVMEYIEGTPPASADALRAAGIDPAVIAATGARVVLDMVLVNGRFHGDPHPGNLLCLPGNRIALLDLGLIGHVSPRRRQEFVAFMQSLSNGDPDLLADVLLGWCAADAPAVERVRGAADRLIARHGGQPLVLTRLVADFMPLLREEGLTLPSDLLLIFKALVTIDGVLGTIKPGFDLSSAMRQAGSRIAAARLSPDHWKPLLMALGWEASVIVDDLPRLLRATMRRLEERPAPAAVTDNLPAARWIATAIVIGAAIVAAALLWTARS